uniref:PDZ domain-containing protein n=1 Tax=Gadus morhua TaxID=8049 RepID=A0A8C4ZBI0_GADMO
TATPFPRRPRLCFLSTGGPNPNPGFGFHLRGERTRGGQWIRRVEPGSCAELSGLRAGDRVVEVNGENVERETHHQVVDRIQAGVHRTRLLVIDRETDEYLRSLNLPCTEDLARPTEASPPPARGEEEAELVPRLCHLTKQGEEPGYGFNLHSDKMRRGQFVGSVDPGSPAQRADVREGDRLLQVNGASVAGLRHAEVVALIQKGGRETRLLLVDLDTDELFLNLGVEPSSQHLQGTLLSPKSTTNGSWASQSSRSSTTQSELSSSDMSIQGGAPDPFLELGLRLSPTAAEAKEKALAQRSKKRAPPMDWGRKYQIFSNF